MPFKSERVPVLSPVRSIIGNDSLPVKYNTWPFNRGFFDQQLREYQYRASYQQKWNLTDRLHWYFDSLATAAIIHILNEDGVVLASVPVTTFYAVAGNTASNGDTYNSFYKNFKLSDYYAMPVGIDQEVYYFVTEHLYDAAGSSENSLWVSEPQFFRRNGWAGTVLLEYTNEENDYDVMFAPWNYPVFAVRVEGDVQVDEIGSHSTTFEDMGYAVRKLQEVPTRLFKFQIGANEGIPAYIHEIVNAAVICDRIRIDGTRYVKDQGSKWELKTAKDYPLRGASIQLQQYISSGAASSSSTTSDSGSLAYLMYIPTTGGNIDYPIAFRFVALNDEFSSHVDGAPTYAQSFADDSELDAYITYLNSTFAPAADLTGTFSRVLVDGVWRLVYLNGTSEFYSPAIANQWAYNYYLELHNTVSVPGAVMQVQLAALTGGSGQAVIDWGDGHTEKILAVANLPAVQSYTRAYAVNGNYTIRIYHSGPVIASTEAIAAIKVNGATGNKVYEIPNGTRQRAPFALQLMQLQNHNFAAEMLTFWLTSAKPTLSTLSIVNCNIGSFANNIFNWGGGTWMAINNLFLSNNALSSTEVNEVVNKLYANSVMTTAGLMVLTQTPPAAPSGAALTLINDVYITANGWTVLHD